jgi:probable rRNA maturation factor
MDDQSKIQNPKSKIIQDPGSNYLITVQMEPDYEDRLDADRLHRLAIHVLESERVESPLELGIVVTTDEEVLALNRQYLGHDYHTDVLSFGMNDRDTDGDATGFVTPAERAPYLGDVVISYDRAAEQAPDYNHSTEAEVDTLLVHGLLHLLGYDDTEEEKRETMHARQQELIATFG